MAEEFQLGRGNWWESSTSTTTTTSSSSRNKFIDSGNSSCTTPSVSSTTVLSSMESNFVNWQTEIHEDIKVRSDNSSMVFLGTDSHKPIGGGGGGAGQGVLSVDRNLQMMGLGLSPQGLDWNQPFLNETSGSDFRSILQEGLSSNANYQQEVTYHHEQDHNNWSTQKLYHHGNSDDSSVNDYNKQILNHQSRVLISGQNNLDQNSAPYGSPSNMLQGLLISDHNSQESNNFTSVSRSLYYNPSYNNNPSNCDVNNNITPVTSIDVMSPSSSSKFPQFLRASDPPKVQQWPLQPPLLPHGQSSHFAGVTPFWSATSAAADDVRSGFVSSLHPQLPIDLTFDEKPKHTGEVRNISTITKKNSSETSNKRPRNEQAPSPLPAFKVRKEKMGDRITALQQLVSPFGKTDTALVLSETIEYIKFLHEQVNVLSTPYMKSGASMQHQQSGDKSNNVNEEGGKQDLTSRGLCLVPVSSTFPVTHETTVDFWTPTFGGTFR